MAEIESHEKPSRWRSWRITVLIGALTSSVVFLINIGILAWAWSNFEVQDGIATVFEGRLDMNCCSLNVSLTVFHRRLWGSRENKHTGSRRHQRLRYAAIFCQ